jgi:outer membrane biosynthesis protein TonB
MMPTTTNDDSMKNALGFSTGFHLFLLLLLYFGMPILFKPTTVYRPPVPFEIVDIADITNTRIKDTPEPPKPPEPPPQPAQRAQAPQSLPTPPAPTPPAPKPVETPAPEALLPKPVQKPQEKPKPQDNPAFSSLLKNLTKPKPQAVAKPTPDAKLDSKQQQQAASSAPSLSSRLTMTEEDALRRQIESCWSPPVGARDAQNLVIDVKITVNPDRTVASAEVVDKSRMATDPFYRTAGEAAVRAVLNPKCSPLELPADKYDQWKNTSFTFDPKDL